MSREQERAPQPPPPPEITRRVHLDRLQRLALPVILLLPLLMVVGVLDERTAEVSAEGAGLRLTAHYPGRLHHGNNGAWRVAVANTGATAVDAVAVSFGRDHMERLANASFTPQVTAVTADGYIVQLGRIEPGEVRRVTLEAEANYYFGGGGRIAALLAGDEVATVSTSTFVLP